MIRYRLRQPLPSPLVGLQTPEVTITLDAAGPDHHAPLAVAGRDPRFVEAVRRRILRAYGFRGSVMHAHTTPRDLHCAMASELFADLAPEQTAA